MDRVNEADEGAADMELALWLGWVCIVLLILALIVSGIDHYERKSK